MNACVHTYTKPQTSSTRSRGLGWRIHESVEDTKLSNNKQHSLRQKGEGPGAPSTVTSNVKFINLHFPRQCDTVGEVKSLDLLVELTVPHSTRRQNYTQGRILGRTPNTHSVNVPFFTNRHPPDSTSTTGSQWCRCPNRQSLRCPSVLRCLFLDDAW